MVPDMKYVVWIVSALLALAFLFTGGAKLLTSTADLAATAQGIPVILLRIAGTAEVLGALGLILPAATRILPILTPLAAAGLVVTMIGATITNLIIGAYPLAVQTVVLGLLAAFVAWARLTRQSVQPRSRSAAQDDTRTAH
ncbi:MAG: DoxX family membrane protein [Streptosporangiales bacterium]|nr:DoxX family membrane protein [Streptosporangiales bacterium]